MCTQWYMYVGKCTCIVGYNFWCPPLSLPPSLPHHGLQCLQCSYEVVQGGLQYTSHTLGQVLTTIHQNHITTNQEIPCPIGGMTVLGISMHHLQHDVTCHMTSQMWSCDHFSYTHFKSWAMYTSDTSPLQSNLRLVSWNLMYLNMCPSKIWNYHHGSNLHSQWPPITAIPTFKTIISHLIFTI